MMLMYKMQNLSHPTFAFYTYSLSHFRAFALSHCITSHIMQWRWESTTKPRLLGAILLYWRLETRMQWR